MGMNLILLCVGIIICFGGIHFKRFFSAITGAAWGSLLGVIITFLIASSLHDIDEKTEINMIICALVACILCAIYDKACTIMASFITVFCISITILLLVRKQRRLVMFLATVKNLTGLLCVSSIFRTHKSKPFGSRQIIGYDIRQQIILRLEKMIHIYVASGLLSSWRI